MIRHQFVMLSRWTSWSNFTFCMKLFLQAHAGIFVSFRMLLHWRRQIPSITRLHASLLNAMRSVQRLLLPVEWNAIEEVSTREGISYPCQLQKIMDLNALAYSHGERVEHKFLATLYRHNEVFCTTYTCTRSWIRAGRCSCFALICYITILAIRRHRFPSTLLAASQVECCSN